MLSVKENFMRALRGEEPEYVPQFNVFWSVRPSFLRGERVNGGVGKDIFGVEWIKEGSAIDGAIPKPNDFILDDIRKWRDVIKFPDFSDLDWESVSKKDIEQYDPNMPRGGGTAGVGFFQTLMSFMGFTEGLVACHEEPDEVKALVNYLCDCSLSIAEKFLHYYKPDYVSFADDIATERSPFISHEMFLDIFEPAWRRYIKFFKDRGYLASHHNCGRFEPFLDDVVDMGYNAWNPAQSSNDLIAIKKKFGNKLLICTGVDSKLFLPHIDVTEEQVREMVRKLLDDLAPGGGLAFNSGGSASSDPIMSERQKWVSDEFEKRKGTYYSSK